MISQFGVFLNISPFYISFIITPFCSNASEVVASIMFAAKMSVASSSMTCASSPPTPYRSFLIRFSSSLSDSFSQLYGAATMNNTLVLGVFYALIYFRGLSWTFSAETLTILCVTWIVCGTVFPYSTTLLS